MRVKVTPLRQRGRVMHREERNKSPTYVGELTVAEARDHAAGRAVRRARLVDAVNGLRTDVLPELSDTQLLWVADGQMRLAGFEHIEGVDYAQTWSVKLER